jgi:hypothetical protein
LQTLEDIIKLGESIVAQEMNGASVGSPSMSSYKQQQSAHSKNAGEGIQAEKTKRKIAKGTLVSNKNSNVMFNKSDEATAGMTPFKASLLGEDSPRVVSIMR